MVMPEKTVEEVGRDNRMLARLLEIARRETVGWQSEAVRLAIENEDLAKRVKSWESSRKVPQVEHSEQKGGDDHAVGD